MDFVGRHIGWDTTESIIAYADVNGDKQDEIIVYGINELIVLAWDFDHYKVLYRRDQEYGFDYLSGKLLFHDWTNDGISEIVLDSTSQWHIGTGINSISTERSILHCGINSCENVWNKVIASQMDDWNTGGLDNDTMELSSFIDKDGNPIIRAIDERFSIYCCFESESIEDSTSLYIYPSVLSIYTWSGKNFELTDEQIINLESRIKSMATLADSSSTGINAKVIAKDNHVSGDDNDFCQLIINGENVGKHFGCRHNFTTVEWKDVTGDSHEEVVIITYSAGIPYDDSGGDVLSDEVCMHQRLIAYQSDGTTNTEIANVAGCVIQKDLYGVRLQDYDGDGIPEIFAAPNADDYDGDGIVDDTTGLGPSIQLNNRAYKWNGKKFVYLSDFPLEK
jgi:hypothetical protein